MEQLINYLIGNWTGIYRILSIVIQSSLLLVIFWYTKITRELMNENKDLRTIQEKMYRLIHFKECCNLDNFHNELAREGTYYAGRIILMDDQQKTIMFDEIENDFEENRKCIEELKKSK